MKQRPLWQISVTTSREAEEAVSALLERLFGQPASSYSPDSAETSVAAVYTSQSASRVHSKRAALEAGLLFLQSCDLSVEPARVSIRQVPRVDWATSWRKYFKRIEIGHSLVIKPSWSKRPARRGQAVVILDPGLSFGTGQHPTTSYCLHELVRARKLAENASFLDIGTGSGILAISAAKLGFSPTVALDNDSTAVRIAKANAKRNRVSEKITIRRQDLEKLRASPQSRFDVICANLMADLLISQSRRILSQLSDRGRLIVAGILDAQFLAVRRTFESEGLTLETETVENNWRSGTLVRAEG